MSGLAQTAISESVAECTDSGPSTDVSPTGAAPGGGRPLRRDAERNRARILDAARDLFAEQGLGVGVDEIARRAGVGMGTLYRRFPNKDALVEAILQTVVEQSRADARLALATQEPDDALRWFIGRSVDHGSIQRVFLSDEMWTGRSRELIYEQVIPLLAEMFDRARDAGALRTDVTLTDFLVLMRAIRGIIDVTERVAPGIVQRYLDMIFDGLRPGAATRPLQPGPLDMETYRRATDHVPG